VGSWPAKYNDGLPKDSRLGLNHYGWLRDRVLKPARLEKFRAFGKLAAELGISQAVLAIAWFLKNQNVSTVILGASKVGQLEVFFA
jgi:aryl-alcohol dehydrogenase-like predicted oxidoreductase